MAGPAQTRAKGKRSLLERGHPYLPFAFKDSRSQKQEFFKGKFEGIKVQNYCLWPTYMLIVEKLLDLKMTKGAVNAKQGSKKTCCASGGWRRAGAAHRHSARTASSSRLWRDGACHLGGRGARLSGRTHSLMQLEPSAAHQLVSDHFLLESGKGRKLWANMKLVSGRVWTHHNVEGKRKSNSLFWSSEWSTRGWPKHLDILIPVLLPTTPRDRDSHSYLMGVMGNEAEKLSNLAQSHEIKGKRKRMKEK